MRLHLLAVTCALVAGCTSQVAEAPAAPPPSSPAPAARPKEVRLEGVDPCALLTAEQRGELGLDGDPVFTNPPSKLFGGPVPTCTITGLAREPVTLGIGTVTSVGIERWHQGDLAANVRPTTVAEFPAVVAAPTRLTNVCNVEVDVAAGQLLDVQFSDAGGQSPITQDELCRRAQHVAEETMATLLVQ